MATTATVQVLMPEMGESVTEGTVLEWHVSEGDEVDEGQTLVEVSTDKVDAEVPAPAAGTVAKILAQPDEEIAVGKPLAEISPNGAGGGEGGGGTSPEGNPRDAAQATADSPTDDGGGAPEGDGAAADATAAADGKTVEIKMPEMGESVSEGTVLEWHVSEGDSVEEGDTVVEVSTDKVDAEVPAPAAGTITAIKAQPDETVAVGDRPRRNGSRSRRGRWNLPRRKSARRRPGDCR